MADDRLLLESFSRPENLVEYHIKRVVDFEIEHGKKLEEIQDAINPQIGAISDAPADPIVLTTTPIDRVEAIVLCHTSNEPFSKLIASFALLCDEVLYLQHTAREQYYPQLALFGHTKEDDQTTFSDGVIEAMMGKSLSFFQECANFCGRVNAVVLNLVHQLSAVYGRDSPFSRVYGSVTLQPATLALGDALTILITIDSIVSSNSVISRAWESYKKMSEVIAVDPTKFGYDRAQGEALTKLLAGLERTVMSGSTFQDCLDQEFHPLPADSTGVVLDYLRDSTFRNLEWLMEFINSDLATVQLQQAVGQYGVYALMRSINRRMTPDKRVFEKMWKLQEKFPMVVLYSKYVWMPDVFLERYCYIPDVDVRRLAPKDPNALRLKMARDVSETLPDVVGALYSRVITWSLHANEAFAAQPLTGPHAKDPLVLLNMRSELVIVAVRLTHTISRTLSNYLNYHIHMSKDFQKKCIDPLAKCLEMLKVMEATVKQHNLAIVETLQHIVRERIVEVLNIVSPLRLQNTTKGDVPVAQSIAAAAELIENLATTTESWAAMRRIILALAVSVTLQKGGVVRDDLVNAIRKASWMLEVLVDYHTSIRLACDTSVVYWVRDLMPALTACTCTIQGDGPGDIDSRQGLRLQFLFTAFSDAARMLNRIIHLPPPPPPVTRLAVAAGSKTIKPVINSESPFANIDHPLFAYEVFLHSMLHHHIIRPLARTVENELRVHVVSSHLAHMDPPGIRSTSSPVLVHLLRLPPIRLFSSMIDIKQEVTYFLESQFYELTTVALHDWKTYGEMAGVAADKYDIHITDNHLPMGCLDSGLDVLQIMRFIHVFASKYNYNIHQQFFLEKKSTKGSKHLNTVSIESISSSIRQHGTGMMNTTVNLAYQYLSQKFFIFSQFLYDEYIKSYLMKERRYFRRERKEKALDCRYSYDHALELNRDMRKLGMTGDKSFYLDKFRQLIAEIGNALGYVRMVRTAGMHAASEAVKFVPDLSEIISFEEAAKSVASNKADDGSGAAAGLSPETLEAAKTLDAVLGNLTKSFAEGVDYFQILVAVIQHGLLGDAAKSAAADGGEGKIEAAGKSQENAHLKNFFLIIPALTINFVDNLRSAKDRMEKGVRGTEAFFSDDGFPLGIAYILAVLKQDRAFESLHWWESVSQYHESETKKLSEEASKLGKSKADSDRRDEIDFKIKRIIGEGKEMQALFYAYRGARNFFRQESEDDDDAIAAQL